MAKRKTPRERDTGAGMARRLSITKQSWSQAIAAGRIDPPGEDGKHDVLESVTQWERNRKRESNDGSGSGPKVRTAPKARDWSSLLERERYLKARIERHELEGLLVRRDAAEIAQAELASMIRSLLGGVGADLRDELAAETDARKCGDLVDDAIRDVLTKVSDQLAELDAPGPEVDDQAEDDE